jgi:hypothetical protein
MSAGVFTLTRYESSYSATQIHPIRCQPETLTASIGGTANTPPAGASTNPISAKISLTNREIGLRPRYVVLKSPATDPPDGYAPLSNTRIPALTEVWFALAVKGAEVSYLGATFTVVNPEPEQVN